MAFFFFGVAMLGLLGSGNANACKMKVVVIIDQILTLFINRAIGSNGC